MFTQPCFIIKNTPELRKKLENLGYTKNSPHYTDDCNIIFAYQYPVKGFDNPYYVIANAFDIPFDKESLLRGKFIDCGTNDDLFLALAALRDDSDYMQWFCSDEPNFDDRCFFVSQCKTLNEYIQGDSDWDVSTYHKATVEELIEYFKNE